MGAEPESLPTGVVVGAGVGVAVGVLVATGVGVGVGWTNSATLARATYLPVPLFCCHPKSATAPSAASTPAGLTDD